MLLFWCTPVTGQEQSPNPPATEAVERDALKLLNDSDWAHTVKPSLQDTAGGPEKGFLILYLERSIGINDCTIFLRQRNAEGAPGSGWEPGSWGCLLFPS